MFEATAGTKTSEFKVSALLSAVLAAIAAFKPELLSAHDAAQLGTVLWGAYAVSRGVSKHGKP